MNKALKKAYDVLEGREVEDDLFVELSKIEGEDILDLVSLANKVRNKFSPGFHACTIMNAKSGICGEDCRFCAQSSHYDTGVDTYDLVSTDDITAKADEAYAAGVSHFGIVTSGTGYTSINAEFEQICSAVEMIRKKHPGENVCASLGNLSDQTSRELARLNIAHYNINIQTNPEKYGRLVSGTHDVTDRIDTIKHLKKYGVKVCSGGILGLGETIDDRLKMAFALRELDVDVIPLNVLIPIEKTPLENQESLSVADIARTFALFRLIHPGRTIKFAAGRETRMKDFQGLVMLAGANGIITGGYLTTRGRSVDDDHEFIAGLEGFA